MNNQTYTNLHIKVLFMAYLEEDLPHPEDPEDSQGPTYAP